MFRDWERGTVGGWQALTLIDILIAGIWKAAHGDAVYLDRFLLRLFLLSP